MSNFPQFSSRAGSSVGLELVQEAKPLEGTDWEFQEQGQCIETLPTSGKTTTRRGGPRGRPPGRRTRSTTSSSRVLQELKNHTPDREAESKLELSLEHWNAQ